MAINLKGFRTLSYSKLVPKTNQVEKVITVKWKLGKFTKNRATSTILLYFNDTLFELTFNEVHLALTINPRDNPEDFIKLNREDEDIETKEEDLFFIKFRNSLIKRLMDVYFNLEEFGKDDPNFPFRKVK